MSTVHTPHPKKDPTRKFTWKRQPYDGRDHLYRSVLRLDQLPTEFDAETVMPKPPIYDQLDEGSCTAWQPKRVVVAADMVDASFQDYSAQFIYWNERALEGTTSYDSGAYIRDSIKALAQYGACLEATWPYLTPSSSGGGNLLKQPSAAAFTEAKQYEALEYQAVAQTEVDVKNAVYNNGKGNYCIIGFEVYSNFWDVGSDGILTMPSSSDYYEGGHAVSVCGWKMINGKLYFKVVNQWGASWGAQGYFYMPAEYLLNNSLASDFWTITKVSGVDVVPIPTPTPTPTPVEQMVPIWTAKSNPNYIVSLNGVDQTPTHTSAFEAAEHSAALALANPGAEVLISTSGVEACTLKALSAYQVSSGAPKTHDLFGPSKVDPIPTPTPQKKWAIIAVLAIIGIVGLTYAYLKYTGKL